jgi:hypothetical protein
MVHCEGEKMESLVVGGQLGCVQSFERKIKIQIILEEERRAPFTATM